MSERKAPGAVHQAPGIRAAISCPALLIAAPASGQGKTTLTAALARWHVRQGRRVRVFKCGPDFLDPAWLELASGATVHNVDPWMTGMDDVRARLYDAARDADIILIEGVMGLFDGEPSAAELAVALDVPVLVLVDAARMAGTFGALVYGLQHYRPGLRWAGVVANRVASLRHADMLRRSVRDRDAWLGVLSPLIAEAQGGLLPERHLGLVSAGEVEHALNRLDLAADALSDTPLCRQPWSFWQQRWSVRFDPPKMRSGTCDAARPLDRCTVAVARDAAFCFVYPANLECLDRLGATIRFFSPLAGDPLPECDAIWLPGGYPELHAATLSRQDALRQALHRHVQDGRPVWAECGGMLLLMETLTDAQGQRHPLMGILPGHAVLQKRRAGLGMQQLGLQKGTLRGHTFHYSTVDTEAIVVARTRRPSDPAGSSSGESVFRHGSVHASFFHAWFASHPPAVAALFGAESVCWGEEEA